MKIDPEIYARSVALRCPTCAGTDFKSDADSAVHACLRCGREIRAEDLERENSELINAHVDEMK